MPRLGKLVAFALLVAVLAMPAAALLSCWRPAAMTSACPLCATMTHRPAPDTFQTAPTGGSCCDLSSGKPAPASVLYAPTVVAVAALHVPSLFAAVVAPPRRAELCDRTPASAPASPQAVLCTFLI